jgi:hypothetical protein
VRPFACYLGDEVMRVDDETKLHEAEDQREQQRKGHGELNQRDAVLLVDQTAGGMRRMSCSTGPH